MKGGRKTYVYFCISLYNSFVSTVLRSSSRIHLLIICQCPSIRLPLSATTFPPALSFHLFSTFHFKSTETHLTGSEAFLSKSFAPSTSFYFTARIFLLLNMVRGRCSLHRPPCLFREVAIHAFVSSNSNDPLLHNPFQFNATQCRFSSPDLTIILGHLRDRREAASLYVFGINMEEKPLPSKNTGCFHTVTNSCRKRAILFMHTYSDNYSYSVWTFRL